MCGNFSFVTRNNNSFKYNYGKFCCCTNKITNKKEISRGHFLIYQLAVWINAVVSLIALTIIGIMIGFEKVYGNIVCSLECTILVGIIVFLIIKYLSLIHI